jgi:hypothetical protein
MPGGVGLSSIVAALVCAGALLGGALGFGSSSAGPADYGAFGGKVTHLQAPRLYRETGRAAGALRPVPCSGDRVSTCYAAP